jgi:hypothetical protein
MFHLVLAIWSGVAAQPGVRVEPTPITPGVSDVSPLMLDLAVQPIPLDQDAGFQRVYRLSPEVRFFGGGGFARRSGAITAIFPQSVYLPGRDGGAIPVVPPGTVFVIGDGPTAAEASSGPADAVAGPQAGPSLSAVGVLAVPNEPGPGPRSVGGPGSQESIWTSDAERASRVCARLDEVAGVRIR